MTVAEAKPIYRANAHLVRQQLQFLTPDAKWVPYTIPPASVFLSLTPTGSAIAGLGPFTAAYNAAGELVYTIPAATVTAGLAALPDGGIVYQVVTAGPNNEYKGVTPLRITAPRYVR